VVFSVEDGKKKGTVQKVMQALYFTYSWGSPPPVDGFSPNFAHQEICQTYSSVQILVWKN